MKNIFIIIFIFFSVTSFSQKKWKIAYVHWQDTVSVENSIKIMDLDGKKISTIIDYPGSNWMAMASDHHIFFQIRKDISGKKMGLYKYDINTKTEKWMFDAGGLYQDIDYDKNSGFYAGGFVHKPEGANRSQYDIFLFNGDGSVKKPLTSDTAIDLEPFFSPDGKQIVFRSNRDRNPASWAEFEIYTMNIDGTGMKRLTYNPDTTKNVIRANNPVWLPGGKIAFNSHWDGNYRLMIMNADGSDLKPLIPMEDFWQTGFDFSKDGKMIVFCGRKKDAKNSDIYLINTDGTNLRQLTNDWKIKVQPIFVKTKRK